MKITHTLSGDHSIEDCIPMMTSLITATLGGVLIGLSASALLYFSGRIAGISGILAGIFSDRDTPFGWRDVFLMGLFSGGLILSLFLADVIQAPTGRSALMICLAGFLVGVGTRLGSGCTSGHGDCGLSRFSSRSLVATLSFILSGVITATFLGMFGGVGS